MCDTFSRGEKRKRGGDPSSVPVNLQGEIAGNGLSEKGGGVFPSPFSSILRRDEVNRYVCLFSSELDVISQSIIRRIMGQEEESKKKCPYTHIYNGYTWGSKGSGHDTCR